MSPCCRTANFSLSTYLSRFVPLPSRKLGQIGGVLPLPTRLSLELRLQSIAIAALGYSYFPKLLKEACYPIRPHVGEYADHTWMLY